MKVIQIYNTLTGELRLLPFDQAQELIQAPRSGWSEKLPPPAGWQKVVPRYRALQEVRPAPLSRFRFEPPHTATDVDVWQYAERVYRADEIIETTAWPHPTFVPLNYSAEQVLEFFKNRQKSRMPLSPWHDGKVRLDDGMSSPMPAIGRVNVPPVVGQ